MNQERLQRRGYSVRALREMARQRLPQMVFDMVDGAAGDEITMRRNEAALAEIAFAPRFLDGAPRRDQSVELLGLKLPSPVILGPTGLAGLLWPKAEVAAARAAAKFGAIYTTSHASTVSLEEIAASAPGPKWMQVFLFRDRAITAEFADRARDAGYQGLVLTIDNQVTAGRDRDLHNGMTFPLRLAPGNMVDLLGHPGWLLRMRSTPRPTAVNYAARIVGIGGFGRLMGEQLDPAVDWRDFDWLRGRWRGPMVVKGLLHPDEARQAQARGADAVVVSNHGGRQLDGALASIEALPFIVEAVGDKIPVLVDGGFRRGVDVIKALALGARAVLIGRPHLWGVACAGEAGVAWVLELYRREIDRALALGGWDGTGKLDRSALRLPTIAS
jgi:L-lactate dehydrogenase (cytochrome)/(S)-mandelate dehydrogenase